MLDTDYIEKMLNETIDRMLEEKVNEVVENAKKELETEIPRIVAGLSIQLMEVISMERNANELLIRVKMDKKE